MTKFLSKLRNYFVANATGIQDITSCEQLSQNNIFGRMANRDKYQDIKGKINTDTPIIIDAGANVGNITALFQQQYKCPTIYAFEPIPELTEGLQKRFEGHANIYIIPKAVGAETKTISFNLVNNLVSSSIFPVSDIKKHYHGEKVGIKQILNVNMVRLDEALNGIDGIDILKLDLQGYELEALKGCGDLLKDIKIVTTEIEFVPLYESQPLFGDIDIYLRSNGFKLLNLYELWTQQDGQLTAGDAVYLNERWFDGNN